MAAVLPTVRRLGKGAGLRHSFQGVEREGGVAEDRTGGCVCGAMR